MKKLVIIINGKGGVGKDTLCGFAAKAYKVKNVSAITPIKEIARQNGWKGEKDAKSRKLLADLKRVFIEYNDLPCRYLCEEYNDFLKSDEEIMFVHIRETEEIKKFREKVRIPCITLLITRKQMQDISWGNESDDNVIHYDYDFEYHNDGELKEAEKDFISFIKHILENSLSETGNAKC